MELDLNQEPLDSPHGSIFGLGSLLNELETAHGHIEERIRQLEAVTSRARQRQRWRQSETTHQTVNFAVEPTPNGFHSDDTTLAERVAVATQERTFGARRIMKRNGTHLIARALGMDTDATNTRSDRGNFFDCNICLDMARDPILTHCGHLFCWPCFYQLSYVHLNVKECPVCMKEVTDISIIPIYGNGNDNNTQKSRLKETGLKVPPRPQAHRIESLRQQLNNHRAISSVVVQNIRLLDMIVAMEERSQSQDLDGASFMPERGRFFASQSFTSQVLPAMRIEDSQQHHPFQDSRLLMQGAASFSSLSSALNSAMDSVERLVEDLEASIHRRRIRRNHQRSASVVDRGSVSNVAAAIQRDRQIVNNAADTDSTMARPASSFSTNTTATVVQLENQRTDTSVENNNVVAISSSSFRRRAEVSRISEVDNSIEVNSTMPHSSSSRRRSEFPRVSDVDNGFYREPRRRRLT
ncbi:hypothetical protein P3X46_013052 [Hevea brasiliensis]|uniref:E3 ubiquitin-protein ligase RMA n=1 Tax=Hevea brasiliensis TaxID=3981 RepID=A0ABQ9M4G1_HEVBR|nr:uncharacterized protein LOC110644264 [Hevea brasiliensis]XP_058006857.1 uncharacterized protein LOC110644264 [Hevea brasiliensis]XP_058006858.1 uncharacterized protein LOC110644264 [Hevea brasiliensis]KAJ9174405.1 hypothetical protein P3X46_013052 [Hevea brasiliensis]